MANLKLRSLSDEELRDKYLPLRKEILQDELGWTIVPVTLAAEMLDEYDTYSEQFGIFWKDGMIGAVRLVVAEDLAQLPSSPFLPSTELDWRGERFAEISRLMVKCSFRQHGLMRLLIEYVLATAKSAAIENVVISVAYRPDVTRMLSRYGFRLVRSGFSYHDTRIRPTVEAATFRLECDYPFMMPTADSHFQSIESDREAAESSIESDPQVAAEEYC